MLGTKGRDYSSFAPRIGLKKRRHPGSLLTQGRAPLSLSALLPVAPGGRKPICHPYSRKRGPRRKREAGLQRMQKVALVLMEWEKPSGIGELIGLGESTTKSKNHANITWHF